MHTNGSTSSSVTETNGSSIVDIETDEVVSNNLNNKRLNQNGVSTNGHSSSVSGRVQIPQHQKDAIRLIGQHLLELGLQ